MVTINGYADRDANRLHSKTKSMAAIAVCGEPRGRTGGVVIFEDIAERKRVVTFLADYHNVQGYSPSNRGQIEGYLADRSCRFVPLAGVDHAPFWIPVTRRECDLLSAFLRSLQRLLSREYLIRLQGNYDTSSWVIDIWIFRLRHRFKAGAISFVPGPAPDMRSTFLSSGFLESARQATTTISGTYGLAIR